MSFPGLQPRFLTVDDVVVLQRLAINEFGGAHGIRDQGLLESAVQQAQAGVSSGWLHAYPFEMAAAYGFHLARNHPFVDGNKRIAWLAMRTFLWREGLTLRVSAYEAIQLMLNVASGEIEKNELAKFLVVNCSLRPRKELRDFFAQLSFERLREKLVAIATSYKSGGANELTAIFSDASEAMPVIKMLANLYVHHRQDNENAIHFMQLLCAIHRIAEEDGYEW